MKPKQTAKQNLSKDMKKQGHTGSKKPSNKKLDAEKHLAEKPKKGQHREPSSKKLSSESSLQKSHKLTHIKEFNVFEELMITTKEELLGVVEEFLNENGLFPDFEDFISKKGYSCEDFGFED